MWRFLQVGLFAAAIQFAVVLLILYLFSHPALLRVEAAGPDDVGIQYVFLLTATGISLTRHRLITIAAKNIRRASGLMYPSVPGHGAKTLLGLVGFTALGFGILTLQPPPRFVGVFAMDLNAPFSIPLIWSGMMSSVAAHFGTIAHAAFAALEERA
jgi:hypothetical protein